VAGLSNRYGENNCYLNVVVQALFHLPGFRQGFLTAFERRYAVLGGDPVLRQDEMTTAGYLVLLSLADLLTEMARDGRRAAASGKKASDTLHGLEKGSTAGAQQSEDADLSLNYFRSALLRAVLARCVVIAVAKARREGRDVALVEAAVTKQLQAAAMGDADETFQEVVAVVHASESTLNAVLLAREHPGDRAGMAEALDMPMRALAAARHLHLPRRFFTRELDLGMDGMETSTVVRWFGSLVYERHVCRGCLQVSYRQMGLNLTHAVNAQTYVEVANEMAAELRAAGGDGWVRYGAAIGRCVMLAEGRKCEHPDHHPARHGPRQVLRAERTMLRPAQVVPMTMVWSSYNQSPDILHPFLYSVDGYIDLNQYMVGDAGALREGIAASLADAPHWAHFPPAAELEARYRGPMAGGGVAWPARLRGFIAFNAAHWVVFMDTVNDVSRLPPFQQDVASGWVCFNDSRVFDVAHPMRDAIVYGLQPSVLFWEVLPAGTSIPADWGRDRLHGRVCLACRTVGDVGGPPRSAELPSVASEAEFPSLGGGPSPVMWSPAVGGGVDVNDPEFRARIPKRKEPPMRGSGGGGPVAAAAAGGVAGGGFAAAVAVATPAPATLPAVASAAMAAAAAQRPPAVPASLPAHGPAGTAGTRPYVAPPPPGSVVGTGAPPVGAPRPLGPPPGLTGPLSPFPLGSPGAVGPQRGGPQLAPGPVAGAVAGAWPVGYGAPPVTAPPPGTLPVSAPLAPPAGPPVTAGNAGFPGVSFTRAAAGTIARPPPRQAPR